MQLIPTIKEIDLLLERFHRENISIGFVPTMGALHEGHLTLIRKAKQENGFCVSSVFVNPTQFNNKEDLARYPRTLETDSRLLAENGCDLLFAPEAEEMYPHGENQLLDLDFGSLDKVMEGAFRPGHFRGVATIVNRLFEIVKPDRAYFGKKDYQQLAIVREMVRLLNLPVEIVACPTIREADGLAMSSRNQRLTAAERKVAPLLFNVLQTIKTQAEYETKAQLIINGSHQITSNQHFNLEYLEIVDKENLQPLQGKGNLDKAVALVAAWLGNTRLIDNVELFS
jgi:pantoate--beta-alanine ligase